MLVVLPFHGLSAAIAAMLGSVHFHTSRAVAPKDPASMEGWQDFRRVNHGSAATFHTHDHATLGQHRHPAGHAGEVVVGMDEHKGNSGSGAAPNGPAFVFFLAERTTVSPAAQCGCADWRVAPACAFHSCDTRRRDRPPQA